MTLGRETARPRLRAGAMLFGVVVASATSSAAVHYALCDRDGAPACGNIGQAGSRLPAPPAPAPLAAPITLTVVQTAPLVQVSITQQLVAPHVKEPVAQPAQPVIDMDPFIEPVVAKPLTDDTGDYAAGNVMSKGGGRRHH